MRLLKFKDLINNQTLENKIKFQKQKIKILEDDIKENGDNGFGYKSRQLENLKLDLKVIIDEYKASNK